jgi:hypothetical protein
MIALVFAEPAWELPQILQELGLFYRLSRFALVVAHRHRIRELSGGRIVDNRLQLSRPLDILVQATRRGSILAPVLQGPLPDGFIVFRRAFGHD